MENWLARGNAALLVVAGSGSAAAASGATTGRASSLIPTKRTATLPTGAAHRGPALSALPPVYRGRSRPPLPACCQEPDRLMRPEATRGPQFCVNGPAKLVRQSARTKSAL